MIKTLLKRPVFLVAALFAPLGFACAIAQQEYEILPQISVDQSPKKCRFGIIIVMTHHATYYQSPTTAERFYAIGRQQNFDISNSVANEVCNDEIYDDMNLQEKKTVQDYLALSNSCMRNAVTQFAQREDDKGIVTFRKATAALQSISDVFRYAHASEKAKTAENYANFMERGYDSTPDENDIAAYVLKNPEYRTQTAAQIGRDELKDQLSGSDESGEHLAKKNPFAGVAQKIQADFERQNQLPVRPKSTSCS